MAKDDVKQEVAELISRNRYSKLITFGVDGAPHGRIMTNLPLGKDMVIWFATGLSVECPVIFIITDSGTPAFRMLVVNVCLGS